MPTDGSLPEEIVESIAVSNAKSIGEQPAILANLALANQIFNQNLEQQAIASYQQAISLLTVASVAKGVSLLASGQPAEQVNVIFKLLTELLESARKMTPSIPVPQITATGPQTKENAHA